MEEERLYEKDGNRKGKRERKRGGKRELTSWEGMELRNGRACGMKGIDLEIHYGKSKEKE